MLELPEVIHISRQLGEQVTGKKVIRVLPPTKNHKFCWYNGAPEEYAEMIEGAAIEGAKALGYMWKSDFPMAVNCALMME